MHPIFFLILFSFYVRETTTGHRGLLQQLHRRNASRCCSLRSSRDWYITVFERQAWCERVRALAGDGAYRAVFFRFMRVWWVLIHEPSVL